MKDLKFFVLLDALSKEEITAFHKYLKQMHGGNEDALKVFDYARKLYPDPADNKKLDMDYAFSKIFGKEVSYHRKNMLNTLSDLHGWLKEFLLTQKMLKDTLESQVLWLSILQEKGLEAEYSKQASNLYTEINSPTKDGSKAYLRDLVASHFQQEQITLMKPFPDIDALEECADNIQICTDIINLKMDCKIANLRKIVRDINGNQSSDNKKPKKKDGRSYVLLQIYKEILQLIETEQEVHFNTIEQMLKEQADYLDMDEMHGIFSYLYNFIGALSRKQNDPEIKKKNGNKLFELHKFGIQYGLFTQKGNMTTTQFTNIVNVSCFVDEFEWAKNFIQNYSNTLAESIRDITVLLAQAVVSFHEGNYTQVLSMLPHKEIVTMKDMDYVIRARMLILMCYFEMKEDWDTLINYCISFEAQLGRKSQTGAVGAAMGFIQICKAILYQKKTKEEIAKIIESKPILFNKDWLLNLLVKYKP